MNTETRVRRAHVVTQVIHEQTDTLSSPRGLTRYLSDGKIQSRRDSGKKGRQTKMLALSCVCVLSFAKRDEMNIPYLAIL